MPSTDSPILKGVKPSDLISSSVYIGSFTNTVAPFSINAVTVGNTPLNALSLTPPR
ncbi:unannotated protein [freshwater metagenome]|uniref:Unannotated protein n=1 Tax=freshwater metagenome TaxID=449393 RepID=A0A6J7W1N3_9ZZZZ